MSASLIGRLGSSTFRPSAAAVSMSLTGSCFSSESAPGPFHHGIRRRGGTIFWAALPIASAGPSGHANSPHPSSREGHHSTAGWILELPPIAFDPAGTLSCRRSCLPGPAELGAINPDAVHDHGQPTCQSHDCLFHSAAPGDLHRPGLEPRPFLRTQHALRSRVRTAPAPPSGPPFWIGAGEADQLPD